MSTPTGASTRSEAFAQRLHDPARLSVWCGYSRHEVCRKTPCPCRCHALAKPDEETS